jgi:hypothetical protein
MSETEQVGDPAGLIEAYYDAGWTDGLPVVPSRPTRSSARSTDATRW